MKPAMKIANSTHYNIQDRTSQKKI